MPTFHPPLKARMAFVDSDNGSFGAWIGSDQKRGSALVQVKGCLTGCWVGDLGGFMGQETVKGC
jgi:hypothetical protein